MQRGRKRLPITGREKINQSTETDSEMTKMMELADQGFKTVVNMFRSLTKSINKMRKEMEDRKNNQS